MLDQSFSPENFRKILDYENRKGIFLEGKFFSQISKITEAIKQITAELRDKKGELSESDFKEYKRTKDETKSELKKLKEEKLKEEFERISRRVFDKNFQIEFEKNDTIFDKPTYIQKSTAENYFALKQVQYNFFKLYKVKQANRFAIVSQVKNLLDDGFPKYVIRTDIKDFYESIPHDKLISKINEESLLSFLSKKIITKILKEYIIKSGSIKGVPRGIGISAYLAELYFRDLDSKIKDLPNVTYYARYVDDIIVVFTPTVANQTQHYLKEVKQIIEVDNVLTLNSVKTNEFDLRDKTKKKSYALEYLGYKIYFGHDQKSKSLPVKVNLSRKKIKRYCRRIHLSFDYYENYKKINEKKARKLLIKQIRFLTSNTRLRNNKKAILTGIFYSHSLINEYSDLDFLDSYLIRKINNSSLPGNLVNRLRRFSFKKGFEDKTFIPYTPMELHNIMRIWKR